MAIIAVGSIVRLSFIEQDASDLISTATTAGKVLYKTEYLWRTLSFTRV
jgi:hypothetical protein